MFFENGYSILPIKVRLTQGPLKFLILLVSKLAVFIHCFIARTIDFPNLFLC